MSRCPAPLAPAVLLDYWLGDAPPDVAARTEEHLMACAECSEAAGRLAALRPATRQAVLAGLVPLGLTGDLLARLERDGVRIRHHRVEPGGSVRCMAGPEDDLVSMALAGEFHAGERVDLVMEGGPEGAPEGAPAGRDDVMVDRARGQVLFVERGDVIRRLPQHLFVIRLYGVGEAGRRPIGEYTLHHAPWPGA